MVAMVSAVSSASGATRYYEKDGYYANDGPEHKKGSFWHDKGAEELGLSKQVDPAAFHHVLEGHVPDSDIRLGRVRDGEHQHRHLRNFSGQRKKETTTPIMKEECEVAKKGKYIQSYPFYELTFYIFSLQKSSDML